MTGRTLLWIPVAALAVMSARHTGAAAQLPRPGCILLPAESRNVTTGSRGKGSVNYQCIYDASAVTLTCTNKGGFMKVTTVTSYPSTDDLVDTVSAIPPLTKAASLKLTAPGSTTSTVYTYDRQKRLVREVATAALAVTLTTEYSDWDTHGRPRKAHITTTAAGRPPSDQAITYDDSARTKTIATSEGGRVVDTHVVTFDVNGNQIKDIGTDAGGGSYTSTTTIGATTQVCR
jgi:hypothetical protein